jgi:hypothetical protein
MYSRILFSYRLPFRSITNYLIYRNTLIYLYLDLWSESNYLFLYLVFDPSCATDKKPFLLMDRLSKLRQILRIRLRTVHLQAHFIRLTE